MASPADRRYLDSHEWHKPGPDGTVTIGISQFAVDELTDITYVDVKKKTGVVKAGETFGEIESVKATSDIYCGIDGTVVAFNQKVIDDPSLVNKDPYGEGWLVKVKPAAADGINKLLTAEAYDKAHG
jgi:glycine cleavage system H protein